MPALVTDASTATATYLVDARAARCLLPGDEIDVVELLPGRALLSLACVDYRENDLGDYNEISVAFFVRERSAPPGLPVLGTALALMRGRMATYIHRLPVDQGFTCEAGRRIWGFPKTVDDIELDYASDRVHCRWAIDGKLVLRFSVPRGGARTLPDTELVTYSYIEGVAHRTRFVSGAEGVGFRLGGAELSLGDHPIAAELRGLGLPRRALVTSWMQKMHGRFEAPEKL
jgi:hypothetical protein